MRSSDDARRPRGTRVWLRSLGFVLMPMISLLIFAVIFEVGLRIRPSLIPPKLLLQFEPGMRAKLAKGRFDTRAEMRLLERDDAGPDLWIFKPGMSKHYDFPDDGTVTQVTADDVGFCNEPGSYAA